MTTSWTTYPLAVHKLSGMAVWAVGELPVLVLLVVTAMADERAAVHTDRTTGEPDLEAYNAMLGQLSGRSGDGGR